MLTEESRTISSHVRPVQHFAVDYFYTKYIHNLYSNCDILYLCIVDKYIYFQLLIINIRYISVKLDYISSGQTTIRYQYFLTTCQHILNYCFPVN